MHYDHAPLFEFFQQAGYDFTGSVQVGGYLLVADVQVGRAHIVLHFFQVKLQAFVQMPEGNLVEGDQNILDPVVQGLHHKTRPGPVPGQPDLHVFEGDQKGKAVLDCYTPDST